jgi:hypothetical protein
MSTTNPSLQCSVCGQWKRLHGVDADGIAIQRFYSCCINHLGEIVQHDKEVCDECCKKNCPFKKHEISDLLRRFRPKNKESGNNTHSDINAFSLLCYHRSKFFEC